MNAAEQLEAMINGTYVAVEENDEGVDEDLIDSTDETVEDVDTDEVTNTDTDVDEDTDLDVDVDADKETEQLNDDLVDDTLDTDTENQEEDAHTETDSEDKLSDTTSDEPNYKEFYEQVALAKFTANGKEVEGFKDPADLIRAQQMLHGYSDKMRVFKEYKPFLKALEERKLTENTDKFNLAMSLLDGDPEALKTVLKDKGIDPLELDLDDIKYTPKNVLPSKAQLLIEETYEQADNLGIGDKFGRVVNKDWDVKSLQELVSNGAVRNDLLQHLQDGTYDVVNNEIKRMELLDASGVMDSMSSIEKYRAAIFRLQQQQKPAVQASSKVVDDKMLQAEKAKAEAEFKRKAALKEAEIAEQRKKAASISKSKVVKKPTPAPKLEELKGDAFRDEFKKLLMS